MPQVIPAAIAAFQYAAAAVASTVGATTMASSLTMAAASGLTAAGITGTAAGAISIAGTIAGAGAIAGVSALLQPDVPKVGAQIQAKAGSVIPRTMVMGRTAVAGVLANDTFYSGRDNGVATQFYILSGAGDCGTIEKILIGDDEVTFNSPVNNIYRAVGKYSGALWMCQKSGSWTQAAINFNSGGNGLESGAHPSEWTTNHRLLGCMNMCLMVGRYNEPIKSNGLNGTVLSIVKAENVGLIDPRTGSAATTWAQKQNPWVWAYSYLKNITSSVSPTGVVLAGCNMPDSGIDATSFAYAANIADVYRWTIAGEVVLESGKKNEILSGMCQAGGGSYTFRNGKVYATVAVIKTVAGYLTNDHIRDDISVAPLSPAQTIPNRIIPRFISESNSWKVIDGSVITDASFVTQDGTERTINYEIPYCGNGAAQAAKLAALALVNSREPFQFDVPLMPSGRYLALPGDCLQITADLTDWVGQKILVNKLTGNGDLTSNIHATSETDSKYAWALGQTTAPPDYTASVLIDKSYVATPTGTAWTVTGTQITHGDNIVPCIRVAGSASEYEGCGGIVVEYKPAAGSTWFGAGDLVYTSSGIEITSVTPNTSYNVRIAYYNKYGVRGTFYTPTAVTTGTLQAGTSADGSAAVSAINAINDSSILTKDKKPQVIQDWNTVQTEYTTSNWVSTASGLGITTEVTAYQNAYVALSNYLNSLTIAGGASTNWYDYTTNTAINRTNWNNAWQGYDTTKLALQAKINNTQKVNNDNVTLSNSTKGFQNLNAGFDVYTNATGLPDSGWSLWGSPNPTRVSDGAGGYACRINGSASAGVGQGIYFAQACRTNAYIVKYIKFKLIAGTLQGTTLYDPNGGHIYFANTSDAYGNTAGNGVIGQTYVFSKIVKATSGQADIIIFASSDAWALSAAGANNANTLEVLECGWRDATDSEIKTQTVEVGADVTGNNTALSIINQAPAATDSTIQAGATKNTIYRQTTAPISGMTANDIFVNTVTGAVYTYSGSAWVLSSDITGNNTALAIVDQGALATQNTVGTNDINAGAVTASYSTGAGGSVVIPANGTWTDVAVGTYSTTQSGSELDINWSMVLSMDADNNNSGGLGSIRLLVDGNVLSQYNNIQQVKAFPGQDLVHSINFVNSLHSAMATATGLSVGSHTIKLQAKTEYAVTTSNYATANYGEIRVTERKK